MWSRATGIAYRSTRPPSIEGHPYLHEVAMPLVEYEVKGRIAYITLNRPEKLNAINHEMLSGLWDSFTRLRDDPEVWLGIVTGTGRAFSVGHDLVEMTSAAPGEKAAGTTDELYFVQQQTWKPVIAAVNGICLAQGAGIALGADLIVAAESAQFGWPQVKRGLTSISGPVTLSQRIPLPRAMEALLTGEFIPAAEALKLGLVNYVVPGDQLMSKAEELAGKVLENAPLAVRGMKEAAVRGLHLSLHDRLGVATSVFDRVSQTEDAREGIEAFKGKRPPVWKGR